jgi:hypothetical protein
MVKTSNIHVLLIHVSEKYNTIMSLHALGISVEVHIRQLSVKLFFDLKSFTFLCLRVVAYVAVSVYYFARGPIMLLRRA